MQIIFLPQKFIFVELSLQFMTKYTEE